jgi:hypothetical protein
MMLRSTMAGLPFSSYNAMELATDVVLTVFSRIA